MFSKGDAWPVYYTGDVVDTKIVAVATGRILENRTESLNTAALDQALRTTLRAECAKKEDECSQKVMHGQFIRLEML